MLETIVKLMFQELAAAEKKFPGFPIDPVHGAAIMTEECGEALKAAVDFYYGRGSVKEVMKEIAQTGAMAIRFMYHFTLNFCDKGRRQIQTADVLREYNELLKGNKK